MNTPPKSPKPFLSTSSFKEEQKTTIEDLISTLNRKANSYELLLANNERDRVNWQEEYIDQDSIMRSTRKHIEDLLNQENLLKVQNEDLAERIYKLTIGSEEAKTNEQIINAIEESKVDIRREYKPTLNEKIDEYNIIKEDFYEAEKEYIEKCKKIENLRENTAKLKKSNPEKVKMKDDKIIRIENQIKDEHDNAAKLQREIDDLKEVNDEIINKRKEQEEKRKENIGAIRSMDNKISYDEINEMMARFSKKEITKEELERDSQLKNTLLEAASTDNSEFGLYLISRALGGSLNVLLSDEPTTADNEISMQLLGCGAYKNCCFKLSMDYSDDFYTSFGGDSELEDYIKKIIAEDLKCDKDDVTIGLNKEESFLTFQLKQIPPEILKRILSPEFEEYMKKKTSNSVKKVEMTPYLSVLKLSVDQMEPAENIDYTDYKITKSKRGDFDYYYPKGWKGYGIKVKGKYENDDWLGCNTHEYPEWAVAYHGIRDPVGSASDILKSEFWTNGSGQRYSNEIDTCTGELCGNGAYLSPHIDVSSNYSRNNPITVKLAGREAKFIVAMQCRVNPAAVRIPEKASDLPEHSGEPGWENDYWIVNYANDVRPYRILYKEIE